jgi:hypothetical protein
MPTSSSLAGFVFGLSVMPSSRDLSPLDALAVVIAVFKRRDNGLQRFDRSFEFPRCRRWQVHPAREDRPCRRAIRPSAI